MLVAVGFLHSFFFFSSRFSTSNALSHSLTLRLCLAIALLVELKKLRFNEQQRDWNLVCNSAYTLNNYTKCENKSFASHFDQKSKAEREKERKNSNTNAAKDDYGDSDCDQKQWQNVIWKYEIMSVSYILHIVSCVLSPCTQKRKSKLERAREMAERKKENATTNENDRQLHYSTYSITVEHQEYVALAISVLKNKCAVYIEHCASYPYSFSVLMCGFIFSLSLSLCSSPLLFVLILFS